MISACLESAVSWVNAIVRIVNVLFTGFPQVFANMNYYQTWKFGNVEVRFWNSAGEEKNKIWIIGQLMQKLATKLNYHEAIFLDFHCPGTSHKTTDYFVSFDRGLIIDNYLGGHSIRTSLKRDALTIRVIDRTCSPEAVLKLVEYAIKHPAEIKSDQKQISYTCFWYDWTLKSIDTMETSLIAESRASDIVSRVLHHRIYRPENAEEEGYISYYFQGHEYYIYFRPQVDSEAVLLKTGDIFQFGRIDPNEAIVFVSDSAFYHVDGNRTPAVSRLLTVKERGVSCEDVYTIRDAGPYKIAISYDVCDPAATGGYRTLLYRIDKDELIQDLDEVLDR